MRLSTKGRYAVMAMTDLAANGADRAVSLAEIATRQQISLPYLEQLFARLRRGGLVRSVRGPGGGYRLSKDAAETRISEIVLAVDEPIRATRCAGGDTPGRGCMASGEQCLTHGLWEALGERIEDYLASVSLDDVVQRRFQSAAPRSNSGAAA
jgi:Rrf2 family iron-sulfur cluster assembly transcriptional regulator